MSLNGPIIIIEDDEDDQFLFREAFHGIGVKNDLHFFSSCKEALDYLLITDEKPFIIISDINIPGKTGLEMKKEINKNDYLRKKSIPFVFLTTSKNPQTIAQAYEMQIQGYFQKPNIMKDLKARLSCIIKYWQECLHPNNV